MNAETTSLENLKALSIKLPEKIPYLKMLVLFGSRARGDTHAKSDWDFAALYNEEMRQAYIQDNTWAWFQVPHLLSEFFGISEVKIDVVELDKSSQLIAHFVARDGKLLYEKEAGAFEAFRQKALKSDLEIKEIRKALREKLEAHLQRWGV